MKVLQKVLKIISKKYNLNYQELLTYLHNEEQNQIEYNKDKCCAIVCKSNILQQCSRKAKTNCFCETHKKKHENNDLEHGVLNCGDNIEEENISKNVEHNGLIRADWIIINDTDYLYDLTTNLVYSWDSKKLVGKLDGDGHLHNFKMNFYVDTSCLQMKCLTYTL